MSRHAIALVGVMLIAMTAVAGVARAAALIVAAQGEITPAVEAFSEADEGAAFVLNADAEMIVLHYAACTETHFRGGEVTVGAVGMTSTGVRVGETAVECPRKVAFADSANAVAAVVLRGDEDRAAINVRPVFVLLDDGFERIEIRRGADLVRQLSVDGRIARWPAGATPLAPGEGYAFVIVRGGDARAAAAVVTADAGVTVVEP